MGDTKIDLTTKAGYDKAVADGHNVPFYEYVTLPASETTVRYVDNDMGTTVSLLDKHGNELGYMSYTSTGVFWVVDKTIIWVECPECGSEYDKDDTDGWSYCPDCGVDVGDDDWEVTP